MANVKNLSIGSVGEDVKTLQTALGFTGEDVDGIYGPKTEAAVIQYQKDNSLDVDGIAGEQTLGKLYGNQSTGAAAQTTTPATKPTTTTQATIPTPSATSSVAFDYPDLEMSDDYNKAMEMIAQNETSHPGEYAPVWEDEANSWLDKYQNRDAFSYDPNSDALYQQLADQYIQQGKLAMEDTMGQAAALTGGYGNSYAQSVGQQVYNQYLGKLNEVGLDLYDRAYARYDQEGQDMLAMYDLYMGREAQERANHQMELDNWYREDTRLRGVADDAYTRSYNDWSTGKEDAWNNFLLEREGMTENATRLITLMTSTGHNPSDEELAAAGMTREQADSYVKAYNESKAGTNRSELINWISSGYNPSDEELAAAGISKEQFEAIKPKAVGKETTISYEERDQIKKSLDECETEDELWGEIQLLLYEGYSREWVESLAATYDKWADNGVS